MTEFNQSAPGNRRVPEPREGYEQRKVSHRKYKLAESRGWKQRVDDGNKTYNGGDYILCERLVYVSDVTVKYVPPIDVPVECWNLNEVGEDAVTSTLNPIVKATIKKRSPKKKSSPSNVMDNSGE